MSSVLVTGGAGFMGSHVSDALIARGDRVVVLDDLSGGFIENLPQQATFVEGSVTNAELVDRLFEQHQFDYVYHLAAYAAEGLSHFIKRFNYENNLIGSVNLINASVHSHVKCFVFTSSIAVYGKNQVPMDESMTPLPEDPYGIAKLAVEMELRASHEMFGLNSVIFRPHNVYGERQNIGDRYRNVAAILMNQLMQNQPMTVFGDGEQTRAFSYISDVAPVIAEAPYVERAYNQVFNVGADTAYTVKTLANMIAKAMNCPADIKHVAPRNEVVHAFSTHKRISAVFGYTARIGLEEGIARMVRWARSAGAKKSKRFPHVEIIKNMPTSWRAEFFLLALTLLSFMGLRI